jgi:hypothetical protein
VYGKPAPHAIDLDAAPSQVLGLWVRGARASGERTQVSQQLQPAYAGPDHKIKLPVVYLRVWSGGQRRTAERANGNRDRERALGGSASYR